jgi:hypothetical protein
MIVTVVGPACTHPAVRCHHEPAPQLHPAVLSDFAAQVDLRVATISLRVTGLKGASDESGAASPDATLRRARILLSAKLGRAGNVYVAHTRTSVRRPGGCRPRQSRRE